jgi:hypothetical protein
MAVQKSVRKEETQEDIFAAFIANESSRKTRKQLIRDVMHDLIVVRYDQAIRKGKIGRAAIKQGKGSSTTAQTRKGPGVSIVRPPARLLGPHKTGRAGPLIWKA